MRTISDLERGVARRPQPATVALQARSLGLDAVAEARHALKAAARLWRACPWAGARHAELSDRAGRARARRGGGGDLLRPPDVRRQVMKLPPRAPVVASTDFSSIGAGDCERLCPAYVVARLPVRMIQENLFNPSPGRAVLTGLLGERCTGCVASKGNAARRAPGPVPALL